MLHHRGNNHKVGTSLCDVGARYAEFEKHKGFNIAKRCPYFVDETRIN